MQYVRNFDKSICFNAALNLARDEKSVSTGRLFQGLTTRQHFVYFTNFVMAGWEKAEHDAVIFFLKAL